MSNDTGQTTSSLKNMQAPDVNNPADANQGESSIVEPKNRETEKVDFFKTLSETTKHAFLTPSIVAVNVVVFALMAVSGVGAINPTSDGLISWGADYGPCTFNGEWWRLLTNTYIHIGFIHLALNMWCLLSIGLLIERLFGNLLFFLIYTVSGITASIVSLSIHPVIISAGASGAIFGLYGALLGYCLHKSDQVPKSVINELRSSTLSFIAYNLVYGFVHSGIDNSAHVGGLLCGTVLGFSAAMPIDPVMRKEASKQCAILTAIAGVAIVFGAIFYLLNLPFHKILDIRTDLISAQQNISDLTAQIARDEASKYAAQSNITNILNSTTINWPSSFFDPKDDFYFYNKSGFDLNNLDVTISFHTDKRSETTLEFKADVVRANDQYKWPDFIEMTSSEHASLNIDSWTEDCLEFHIPEKLQADEDNLMQSLQKWRDLESSKQSQLQNFTWSVDNKKRDVGRLQFNVPSLRCPSILQSW